MSYAVQINLKGRVLTPEEGQKILQEMREQVPMDKTTGSWETIESKNNIKKVDWPSWLSDWLLRGIPGLQYDTINWIFYRNCQTRAEADAIQKWVVDLKEWARTNDAEKFAVLDRTDVKIHDSQGVDLDVV